LLLKLCKQPLGPAGCSEFGKLNSSTSFVRLGQRYSVNLACCNYFSISQAVGLSVTSRTWPNSGAWMSVSLNK
jgi:hypothetical protein